MVKSQRVGRPGYFLQGGIHQPGPKGPKSFVVGQETLFATLDKAKAAHAKVAPAKAESANAPVPAKAAKKAAPAKTAMVASPQQAASLTLRSKGAKK